MLSAHGWKFKISKILNFWDSTSKCTNRARTDLEKFLNLTLVLENSWNFKKVPFVLELSLNFVKFWKYELVLEKYKIRVLLDLWDAQKTFWKSPKTEWKSLDTRPRAKCDSYSIQFVRKSRFLSPESGSKKTSLFTSMFSAEKVHFLRCLIQNWEEIESLKKKPWNSPGILFSHFRTNPVQTINIFLKIQIQKIWNLSKETITICWILHFRLTFKIKSASKFWIQE